MADHRDFTNPLQVCFSETLITPSAIQPISIRTSCFFDRPPIHDPVTTCRTPKHIAPCRVFDLGIRTNRPVEPSNGRVNHFLYPNECLLKLVRVTSCRVVPR